MRTSDFGVMVFVDTKVEDFVFEVCFGDRNRVDEVGVDKDLREEGTVLRVVEFGLQTPKYGWHVYSFFWMYS